MNGASWQASGSSHGFGLSRGRQLEGRPASFHFTVIAKAESFRNKRQSMKRSRPIPFPVAGFTNSGTAIVVCDMVNARASASVEGAS